MDYNTEDYEDMYPVAFSLLSICLVATTPTYFNLGIFDGPSFTNNILTISEVETRFNLQKDYDQIKVDKLFEVLNLDNISEAAPLWLETRTAILKILTETDGLYEYLLEYATHSDVDEEDKIELIERNEYGKPKGLKRLAGLDKKEVEFRASNIIQAHLPLTSS